MPLTFALLLHKFVVLLLSAHHLPLTKPLKPKAFSNKHTNIQLQCQMMFSRHKLSISFTQLFLNIPISQISSMLIAPGNAGPLLVRK